MINVKLLKSHPEIFEAIATEFQRLEWEENSRLVRDPDTGQFWLPAAWLRAMAETPELKDGVADCGTLPDETLAPMSDELRRLCKSAGFPEYTGTATPNRPPQEPPDPVERPLRVRCPRCGSWMADKALVKWKSTRKPATRIFTELREPPPQPSGEIICTGCGYEPISA